MSATISLISARTTPFLLLALLIAIGVPALRHGAPAARFPPITAVTLSMGAFLAFAGLSASWSEEPGFPLTKFAFASIIAFAALFLTRLISGARSDRVAFLAEGLWLGVLIGLSYYLTEILTGQSIKMAVYNALQLPAEILKPARHFTWENDRITHIAPEDMTRNAAPISLLIWPAVLAALGAIARPWNRPVAALLILLGFAAAIMSPHESTKVAIMAGLAGWLLAKWSAKWSHRVFVAAWVTSCIAIIPIVMLAHRLDLHNNPAIQMSGQHRIIIWNHTAEQTLKIAPILGIGANMTYVVGPKLRHTIPNQEGEQWERTLSRHAHNAFLQTWFELGAVGALFLTIVGIAILNALRKLETLIRPYAFASFASAATLFGISYGMWQLWFMAAFGLSVVLFAIARRVHTSAAPP